LYAEYEISSALLLCPVQTEVEVKGGRVSINTIYLFTMKAQVKIQNN
jgi:hypothetical protein